MIGSDFAFLISAKGSDVWHTTWARFQVVANRGSLQLPITKNSHHQLHNCNSTAITSPTTTDQSPMRPLRFCCAAIGATLALLSAPAVIEGFQVAFVYGDHTVSMCTSRSSAVVFDVQHGRRCHSHVPRSTTTTTTLSMIDPITTWNTLSGMDAVVATLVSNGPEIGAAVVGAAAGALSQLPKIQQLNEQVIALQLELDISQTNLTAKIQLLEDKLFEMDREFEDQSARFKRQYDMTQRDRLHQIQEKLQMEYKFKLDIQREELKSQELMKQVDKEHNRTAQQQELSILTLQKQKLEEANVKLEQALQQSSAELQHMLASAAEKARKRFFLF
jgi:hypothetical protein